MIKPLSEYVAATPEEAASKTKSGLYLPESSQEKPKVAVVKAVGDAVLQVKVGDRIVYKSYSTTELKFDDDTVMLVKEEDILATITKEKK